MRMGNRSTKKFKKVRSPRISFYFGKKNFKVINVIRSKIKSLKCNFNFRRKQLRPSLSIVRHTNTKIKTNTGSIEKKNN